jgi:hypothetical protein
MYNFEMVHGTEADILNRLLDATLEEHDMVDCIIDEGLNLLLLNCTHR